MNRIEESKKDNGFKIAQTSKMDELKKLAELKNSGILTEEEFTIEKKKILDN